MTQQVFDRQNIEPIFQQMCSKSMTQRVCTHRLADACLFLGFFYCPLHSTLGISGVKVSTYATNDLLIFALEYQFVGLFCFQIDFSTRIRISTNGT